MRNLTGASCYNGQWAGKERGIAMEEARSGIKSIEVGASILAALAQARGALALKELARSSRMPPSKAHRYLASFIRAGLVEQDQTTRHYTLGPLAFRIGLAAIGNSNPLRQAIRHQAALRDEIDETVVLSVWGHHGATVLHIEESSHPVIMTMKVGAVLPILASATGLVFTAFLPAVMTSRLIEAEMALPGGIRPFARSRSAFARLIATVRRERFAFNHGHLMPGVSAIAVPLVGPHDRLVAVVAVMGSDDRINPEIDNAPLKRLRAAADAFAKDQR
jgi:DNA-binding IclR family transcriptional regulator